MAYRRSRGQPGEDFGGAPDSDPAAPGSDPVDPGSSPASDRAPLPWHIKLLGGAFAVYVVLRLVQMAGWLIRWLTER